MASENSKKRFNESTKLKYGVVEDSIPEGEIYRHDENPVIITQLSEEREYRLHVGSRVGLDSTILFDSVEWQPGEFQGTLMFYRTIDGRDVRTATLDWHACYPTRELGLVGEWFLEQLDLSEYYADVACPECGGEVLHLPMHSACETADCDFFCEGHFRRNGRERDTENDP